MNQNNQIINELFRFFGQRSPLPILIVINIAVFLIINLIKTGLFLADVQDPGVMAGILNMIAVPADLNILTGKPWTLITYMFLHEGFFHIFFNMMILYFAGKLFIQNIGTKKLVPVYLMGGISGAVFFITSYNIFPVFDASLSKAVALGASASVLAVLTAVTTHIPNFSVTLFLFGKVKLKYIVIILLIIDIMSIEKGNPGGHIAHLGGAFFGFVYILANKKSFFQSFNIFKNTFSFVRKPKLRKTYGGAYKAKNVNKMNDDEYNSMKVANQKKIDSILEKISRSGYESLTREEKELLFSQSKKN